MHYVENQAVAQGDMIMRRIAVLPDDVTKVKPEDGKFILTHSETGHHHSVKEDEGVTFYQHANDNNIAYLVVDNTEALVEHERSFDTHAPYGFREGVYEIRRQIESTPEGYRRALD